MVEIMSITLGAMDNGAHYAYHLETMNTVEADSKVKAKVVTQLVAYQTAIAQEDVALKISQKSFITDAIATADAQRDAMYTGFKQAVKGYQKMPGNEIQEATKQLNQLIKDYAIVTTMQLDKETGLMTNFIGDLETKMKTYVDALGLRLFVTQMKAANEKVRTSISARNAEDSARQVGAMKAARANVDNAYRLLVKYVNAYALIEGDVNYANLIALINALIVRYKRQVLGQKVDAAGGEISKPDAGGETENPNPGDGSDEEAPDPTV